MSATLSGRWSRLWRCTCAGCGTQLTWANEDPARSDYPVLTDAMRGARYVGWRQSSDGWRCGDCPSPTGKPPR